MRYGREMNMEVVRNDAFQLDGINVSSSVIRSFLREGEVELANMCLGYPYTIVGKVVNGFHEGRKLGFPTFGGKRTTIETHIFHFDGDIYGQLLLVSFVHRVRGERKFESPEELAEQLREDEETVVALLQKDKENE